MNNEAASDRKFIQQDLNGSFLKTLNRNSLQHSASVKEGMML
jgi:hypothetical protein